jgi:predicted Zn-dependent protease with MMP-like domain
MRLTRSEFEQVVARAIAGIPREFRDKLDNVVVTVQDWPTPEFLEEVGLASGSVIFGTYHGTPLTKQSPYQTATFPHRITLFQGPLELACHTRGQLMRQIRRTVLHEIGHHFGISEKRLRELGV